MELLLGCGNNKEKKLAVDGTPNTWTKLVTLDIDENVDPDFQFDLSSLRMGANLPFIEDYFDEIHAYDVLEHVGKQGDYRGFFDEFYEYWRVLKPNGYMVIIVPNHSSIWAWGDPGHTRAFSIGTWSFLDQEVYKQDIGNSSMTDYRQLWEGNFKRIIIQESEDKEKLFVVLQAIK